MRDLASPQRSNPPLFATNATCCIPPGKEPASIDQKLLEKYGIGVSRSSCARRKAVGIANVHYLRYERRFLLLATHGFHPFFDEEAQSIRDARHIPIRFEGYSIRVAKGGYLRKLADAGPPVHDPKWRVRVQIDREMFKGLIAYLLPGFVALWGVSCFLPTVESWINGSQQGSPTIAGLMYVTLASVAAGMTVSAMRWAVIDQLHHATGIVPPAWTFANLEGKLQAYLMLIENHDRYYQWHSNMFIAVAFYWVASAVSKRTFLPHSLAATLGILALETILLAASRDAMHLCGGPHNRGQASTRDAKVVGNA